MNASIMKLAIQGALAEMSEEDRAAFMKRKERIVEILKEDMKDEQRAFLATSVALEIGDLIETL